MVIPSSVKWRCRRGMRELDLLLERFLAGEFSKLDQAELETLDALLGEPDQDILAWLGGSQKPPERFEALVERIRDALC